MAVVATGFFDGVHPGHRLVIDTLLSEALRRGEEAVVLTFWPHPRAVLQNGADSLRYLSSRNGREFLLRSLGVDAVETVPFTRDFASSSAAEYLDMLRRDYSCSALVLGYDTRFGSEQAGPHEIAAQARRMGIETVIAPAVQIGGTPVSSSRIREALSEGKAEVASELLGRPYRLEGVVVSGDRIGRTIGFPTANMKLYEPLMLIPAVGVYHTRVTLPSLGIPPGVSSAMPTDISSVIPAKAERNGEISFDGVTNIGFRPTVSEAKVLTVETHILGFDEMIYGLDISIDFLARIRDERRFGSLEELRVQLESDVRSIA